MSEIGANSYGAMLGQNPAGVSAQVSGVESSIANIEKLQQSEITKALKEAMAEADTYLTMLERMYAAGHQRTGALYKAIGGIQKTFPNYTEFLSVGVRRGMGQAIDPAGKMRYVGRLTKESKKKALRRGPVDKFVLPSKYAHLLEFGHKASGFYKHGPDVPGYPYVTPTAEIAPPRIANLVATSLQRAIDRHDAPEPKPA